MPSSTDQSTPTPNTFFLRCGSTIPTSPSVSPQKSSPTLAARRLVSHSARIKPESLKYVNQTYEKPLTPPIEFLSPTVIAVTDYYLNLNYRCQLDTPPYSGSEAGTPQMNIHPALRTVIHSSSVPRRHSVALDPYPRVFEEMVDIKLQALEASRRGSTIPTSLSFGNSICIESMGIRDMWMQKLFKDENLDLESSPFTLQPPYTELEDSLETEQQIHNPLEPRYLGNIPFSYTTNKLREWGKTYLFNSATADAFIRAVAISNSESPSACTSTSSSDLHQALSNCSLSATSIKEEDVEPLIIKKLVRVRVVPRCKTKKPFYMQKYFPIRKSSSYRVSKHITSPRYHLRHHHEHYQGTKVEALRSIAPVKVEIRRAVPIHIEYALYRAPLLAAILLCEHVKRGATLEIPLPFPEAWEDVIEWIYTGNTGVNVSAKVRETVEYLGGTI